MNVGGVNIDAKNATTYDPHPVVRFLMEGRSMKHSRKRIMEAMASIVSNTTAKLHPDAQIETSTGWPLKNPDLSHDSGKEKKKRGGWTVLIINFCHWDRHA